MVVSRRETFPPVTLGHIRGHGCRDLLVCCNSINCSHGATMNADHLSDDTPIRPLGLRMVCIRCGHVGADVRQMSRPSPAVQEESDYQRSVRVRSCIRPLNAAVWPLALM